jgi:hypothetical protein
MNRQQQVINYLREENRILREKLGIKPCDEISVARLDEAVELAVAELVAWGLQVVPRAEPPAESLSAGALAMAAYEDERPSASAACRIGDARFLNQVHGAENR